MYSRDVSLNPPFLPLHSGVRTASVITMSSAFLDVLGTPCQPVSRSSRCARGCVVTTPRVRQAGVGGATHICDRLDPGARCLKIDPMRSAAISAVVCRGWTR